MLQTLVLDRYTDITWVQEFLKLPKLERIVLSDQYSHPRKPEKNMIVGMQTICKQLGDRGMLDKIDLVVELECDLLNQYDNAPEEFLKQVGKLAVVSTDKHCIIKNKNIYEPITNFASIESLCFVFVSIQPLAEPSVKLMNLFQRLKSFCMTFEIKENFVNEELSTKYLVKLIKYMPLLEDLDLYIGESLPVFVEELEKHQVDWHRLKTFDMTLSKHLFSLVGYEAIEESLSGPFFTRLFKYCPGLRNLSITLKYDTFATNKMNDKFKLVHDECFITGTPSLKPVDKFPIPDVGAELLAISSNCRKLETLIISSGTIDMERLLEMCGKKYPNLFPRLVLLKIDHIYYMGKRPSLRRFQQQHFRFCTFAFTNPIYHDCRVPKYCHDSTKNWETSRHVIYYDSFDQRKSYYDDGTYAP